MGSCPCEQQTCRVLLLWPEQTRYHNIGSIAWYHILRQTLYIQSAFWKVKRTPIGEC